MVQEDEEDYDDDEDNHHDGDDKEEKKKKKKKECPLLQMGRPSGKRGHFDRIVHKLIKKKEYILVV